MTTPRRANRVHAARVAAVATAVVMACYIAGAVGLSLFVAHRLTGQVDGRLHERLANVRPVTLSRQFNAPAADGDGDLDDAPLFLWVEHHGSVRPLTLGAPTLRRGEGDPGPVTVTLGGSPFRLAAREVGGSWVVAGQSVANISRVGSTLLVPEIAFGAVVAIVSFCGALVIGLRASAPLELVRRRQAEFTADASHELRTPLSVVEAEVDLALQRPRDVAEYQDVLRRIGDEGRRLRKIVDDLLWLARMDSEGPAVTPPGPSDVADAAVAGVERLSALAARRQVDLGVATHGSVPATVDVAPEWLDRLVGVLVDNAIKYAGEGGRVEVGVTSTPTRVLLYVDDSGPGIPALEREVVFDRFRRLSVDAGGTGLGLAIGDSVVRGSGGSWTVTDAPLGGARMQVEWRRRTVPTAGAGAGAAGARRGSVHEPEEPSATRR